MDIMKDYTLNEPFEFDLQIENAEASANAVCAVKTAVCAVIEAENASGRHPCIVLTDDQTIHAYNRDYRNVDRPTDVLSFPADEGDELTAPPDGFLGDVIISVDTAKRQAAELGHSVEREIAFLTVHGMLHLLGYDHIDPDDEAVMTARQREIITVIENHLIGLNGAADKYADQKPCKERNEMKAFEESKKNEMVSLALDARERAYVPYSHFRVGACLLGKSGKYYLGCNIENAAYSPTNCAERTALFKAVSEGETEFSAIAIVSDSDNFTYPCGVCRQALSEFCVPDMPVFCINNKGDLVETTLGALLPMAFTKEDMA